MHTSCGPTAWIGFKSSDSRSNGRHASRLLVHSPAVAAVIFVLFATGWIVGSAHLLENLEPSPYLGLFMTLGTSRMMAVLITLLAVLIWYARTLNELKREAIAISAGRGILDTH